MICPRDRCPQPRRRSIVTDCRHCESPKIVQSSQVVLRLFSTMIYNAKRGEPLAWLKPVASSVFFGIMKVYLSSFVEPLSGYRKAIEQGCDQAESVPMAQNMHVARRQVGVTNVLGLHLRVAGRFVRCASEFQSDIKVYCKGLMADGRSILALLSLAAECGTTLAVEANGTDAEQAVAALAELISAQSHDSEDKSGEIARPSPSWGPAQGAISDGHSTESPESQNGDHSQKRVPRWDSWRLGSTNGPSNRPSRRDPRAVVQARQPHWRMTGLERSASVQQRAAGYTLVWSKSVESRPSPQEPESPKTHPGRSDETDAREPEWDHLRSKLDLPAKDKTDGMEKRDQSKDGPRDDEKRLLLCHRDIPLVLDVVHWD